MKTTLKTLNKHHANFSEGKNGDTVIFYSHEKQDFTPAHKIINLNYTGWFTNDFGDLCIGIVLALPAMPGYPEGRFLAGYHVKENGETVLYADVYDNAEDAAQDADNYAEDYADVAREYQEKFQAARDLEDKIESKEKRLVECLALRHKKCMQYVRSEIVAICQSLRDMRETMQTEYAGVLWL